MRSSIHQRFPVDDIRPLSGELVGAIASNARTGEPLALAHDIAVALAPFRLTRKLQRTTARLFALPLAIRSWRALAGREVAPVVGLPATLVDGEPVADPGALQGAIELLGHHVALRARRLRFGAIASGAVDCELALTLDLAPLRLAPADLVMSTALRLGPIRVLGDIAALARPSLDEARALAARFLDLDDYTLDVVDGVVACVPRGCG